MTPGVVRSEPLGDLADLGANVLEVGYERIGPRLHVDEAEVVLVSRPTDPGTATN